MSASRPNIGNNAARNKPWRMIGVEDCRVFEVGGILSESYSQDHIYGRSVLFWLYLPTRFKTVKTVRTFFQTVQDPFVYITCWLYCVAATSIAKRTGLKSWECYYKHFYYLLWSLPWFGRHVKSWSTSWEVLTDVFSKRRPIFLPNFYLTDSQISVWKYSL